MKKWVLAGFILLMLGAIMPPLLVVAHVIFCGCIGWGLAGMIGNQERGV